MTAKKTATTKTTTTSKKAAVAAHLTALQAAKKKAADILKATEDALKAEEARYATLLKPAYIKAIIKKVESKHGFFDMKIAEKKVVLTKKQTDIVNAVKLGSWGCQTENVHKLISILTDIPMSNFGNSSRVVDEGFGKTYPGMFAVPTCNDNSHHYVVGRVVFATDCDDGRHMRALSEKHYESRGNNLVLVESGLRRPTKDELETFLVNIPIATFNRIKADLDIK